VPVIALSVPNEAAARVGGRAMQQARRYRRLVFAATLATWLLIPSGVIAASSGSTPARVIYHGALIAASLLIAGVLWQTWRTRRHDRLLLSSATLAASLLLLQISSESGHILRMLPPQSHTLHLALTVGLWSVLVALSILSLRRAVPAVPDAAAASTAAAPTSGEAVAKQPSLLRDYISLTKPRVLSLLLLTTLVAMFITGEGLPSFGLVCWTLLGGYLAAGGAGAINMALDSDIDSLMGRTGRRAVPSGRIPRRNAFWFGVALNVLAFAILASFATLLAAVLALAGTIYYTLVYTSWLKRSTWQNIVIGGGAGAIPPLVGWTAVTGTLSLPAVILFMIIFYWTPPHFWALALVKEKDYARAGVPMLPVVAGEQETRWQIWLYSLLLVCFSLLLVPIQAMGLLYLLLAAIIGGIFLRYAWKVWRAGGHANTWGLYKYSLLYLALLFGAMVIDRLLLA
jgi:protoheme IX farnesyltransferase